MAEKKFIPEWTSTPPLPGSYRSIAKQGAMDEIKLPSERYYKLLKGELGVDDSYFSGKRNDGNMPVRLDAEVDVPGDVVDALVKISGSENVRSDSYSRVKYSHGKLQEEMFNLKRGVVHEAAGVVVHPRDKEEVKEIIHLCDSKGVAVNVYGGGSSCNKGFLPERGGVTLVMNTHMKRVLEVNEKNHTCRVQAGCMGPDLENALNNARTLYGTTHAFTCGHFPQSFEISSVAGWSMALGSGQASTYYGDAADLVLAMEVVTPAGVINTSDYISTATGPKVVEMMKGSEGVFGVCVELTIKIFRHMPENRKYFGYIFPDFESAVNATREITQGQFGLPAVLRISDAKETEHAFELYPVPPMVESFLKMRGFKPGRRCLCLGTVEGEREFTALVRKKIGRIARRFGGMSTTGYSAKEWYKDRYKTFYMAEAVTDYDIILDTVETPVRWDNIHEIHGKVYEYANSVPGTMCISHASHFYQSGTNLYFIFGVRGNVDDYMAYRSGLIEAMVNAGGSCSHHHGVGRLMTPWIGRFLGKEELGAIRALKKYFDPGNILNPGHPLGTDSQVD